MPVADNVPDADKALKPLNEKLDASVDLPDIADAADPVGLADSVDEPLILDVKPINGCPDTVLDALRDADLGNDGLLVTVLDPDKSLVRGNDGPAETVDEPVIADVYKNEKLALNELLALSCAVCANVGLALSVLLLDNELDRTKDIPAANVLLDDKDADLTNVGDAFSVAEPLRLAAPVTVVLGAASLAAIKATVI